MLETLQQFFTPENLTAVVAPILLKLLIAVAIYIIGNWIGKRIINLIDKIMNMRNIDPVLRGFLKAILQTLFSFVILLIAVEQLGVNTTSLLALLGAAGLAVGLALKDSLSNFAAGVMLIIFKPFKIGDFVEAGGTAGIVEGISVFNTIFRSPDNKEIIVPNAHVYGGTIVNVSARPTRRIDMVIGVSYDDDLKKVQELVWQVLNADERILKDPEPTVAVSELADSSVNFVVRPWVNSADYWAVKWAFLENIKLTFDSNGVCIPYPQTDVHLKKED